MFLIISTSNNNLQNKGNFFWGSKYLPNIKPYLPDKIIDIIGITEGIVYFNKSEFRELNALKFKITSSAITNNYFKVNYNITSQTEHKSYQIRDTLKKYLNKKSVLELPFCCAVDEASFFNLMQNNLLSAQIENLQLKKKWLEIYQLLEKHQPLEQNKIWNDPEILNKFSFAVAKLSECSENLKKKFSDKNQLKIFLKEKKFYRTLCIKLRERCIELQPENPSYFANLGYTYYQSVRELSVPGGRKDGNISQETQKAIFYLNESLRIQPDRIKELYRRAVLRNDILVNVKLFNKEQDKSNEHKINETTELTELALKDFKQIINIYQNSIKENYNKLNTKKYYIKTLYHLALIYLKKGRIKFDPIICKEDNFQLHQLDSQQMTKKIEYLSLADEYISQCIDEDNYKSHLTQLIDAGTTNNFLIGVHKLYLKGIIQLYLYILTNKTKYNLLAKEFLYKANETNFPKEMQKQNKIFVLEKIAQLNIIEKKYHNAIVLLEPHYKKCKFFPDYAAYTLAVSYILDKNHKAAEELIDTYLNKQNSNLNHKFLKLKQQFFSEIYTKYKNIELILKPFNQ